MTLESRIFSAVRSLVGDRAYPYEAPADVAGPYIVFSLVAGASSYTLSTVVNLDRCLVQVDLYDSADKPLGEFIALTQQVRRAIESAGGRMQSEGRERDPAGLWRSRLDFALRHRRDQ